MWLNDEDWRLIADCVKVFNERHMIYLNQSLVFEKLVDGQSREGLAVMEFHIRKHIEIFRSDQLTVNNKSPHKLMYDSVRIFGLRIAAQLNEFLIKLHLSSDDIEIKKQVVHKLICLCQNSMLLKQNDKHLTANINHLKYSMNQFAALIEQTGLKADFEYAMAYVENLTQQVYPGSPIVIAQFSIEKDYTFAMTAELRAKIEEHQARLNEY